MMKGTVEPNEKLPFYDLVMLGKSFCLRDRLNVSGASGGDSKNKSWLYEVQRM